MNEATEYWIKQSVISTILLFTDVLTDYNYAYGDLINCSLDDLEAIQEDLRTEYNKAIKNY